MNQEKLEEMIQDLSYERKMRTDWEFALTTLLDSHNLTEDDMVNVKELVKQLKEYDWDVSCEEVLDSFGY